MTRGGLNILGSFLASLLLANNVHEVQCGISISAAAASGANYALGGGGGQPQFRDEESEALILLLVASAVGGIIVVMVLYVLWRLFRRYVLKIREPPGNNFQVDKKVKCRAGHNMMLFHVPSNVSSFINCGSKSACEKQEILGGFAAWYSCPVCAFRICSGCASVDIPDFAEKDKFKLENFLVGQFLRKAGLSSKAPEVHHGNSPLPGQIP